MTRRALLMPITLIMKKYGQLLITVVIPSATCAMTGKSEKSLGITSRSFNNPLTCWPSVGRDKIF